MTAVTEQQVVLRGPPTHSLGGGSGGHTTPWSCQSVGVFEDVFVVVKITFSPHLIVYKCSLNV